jgi:hypothetical protein
MHMRSTHHFIAVFSLLRLSKKKRNLEKHTGNIFGVFGFSRKESKTKRKEREKKREKLFTRDSSQQAKEEQGNLFGFSESFSNTQKEKKENKTSKDNTMETCEHRQLKCEHEYNVGEKHVLPQA